MTKTATRRALLLSAVAMLLCLTMFVGTTYAWFTDSVTSSGNKIVSGTLDVQLLMDTGNGYEDISNATAPIFGEGSIAQNNNAQTLWEPGKTQVAYLAIKNNGTLALKYNVALNVTNVSKDLYKVLQYAIIADAQYGSVTSWTSGNRVAVGYQAVSGGVTLEAGATHYFALAIHMDELAGNEYQGGEVNFDLTVLATQNTIENDSFDNLYDQDAIAVTNAAEAQAALDNATAGTTIQLAPGVNYGTLKFRANPGHSNTTEVDIADAWRYNYVRSIEDITIVGAPGAKVDGIIFATGAQPGDCNNTAVIKNLVIDGVEFTDALTASPAGYNAPIMITTSNATVDGLTVKNCTLVGDNDKLQLVYLYAADGSKNVTITGNTVDGVARLCELRGTENVTITNNTIKNTAEHAMLLAGAAYSGTVTITGNTAYAIGDRFVRMAGGENANVVIKNNAIYNYLGSDDDYIKVTDANNVVINDSKVIENNTITYAWNGTIPATKPSTLVVDTVNKVISINSAEAFAYLDTLLNDGNFAANYGAKWNYTVELNADIDLANKAWTPINLSNVKSFDGNGHTISNLNVAIDANNAGLFGSISCNDLGDIFVENFTIDGATVSGNEYVGVVVGVGQGKMKNITVIDATVNGTKYVGGLAGRATNTINCTVKDSTVTCSGKTVGGLVGYAIYDNSDDSDVGAETGNTVANVTVTGAYNVGGMFGQAQYVTVEGNTAKNVTVISTQELPANASSNEVRTAEIAARCVFDNTTIGANTIVNVTLENK